MALDTFIDLETFLKEVSDPITDINDAMSTQTARTAYYGAKYILAQTQAKKTHAQIRKIEGILTQKYRKAFEDAALAEVDGTNKSPARVTAEMVKAAVATDTQFYTATMVGIDADEIEGICRVAYDAFKTRRDMLSSSAYLKGAELKSNLVIQGAKEAAEGYHARRAARDPSYQNTASVA